jgi:hypothetical protein
VGFLLCDQPDIPHGPKALFLYLPFSKCSEGICQSLMKATTTSLLSRSFKAVTYRRAQDLEEVSGANFDIRRYRFLGLIDCQGSQNSSAIENAVFALFANTFSIHMKVSSVIQLLAPTMKNGKNRTELNLDLLLRN